MAKGKEYSCEELKSSNARDWNKLNEENGQGSFYHTLKWKEIVERSNKTRYFLVYRDGEVAALCPFYETEFVAKGFFPITALQNIRNIVFRYPDDALVARQIALKCKEIMMKERLTLTKINLAHDAKDCFRSMNLHPRHESGPSAGNMILDLREYSPERIWNSLSKKDRRRCSRCERDGWVVDEIKSEEELASFYAYYKANLQCLRTRLTIYYEFSHFEHLRQTFMTSSSPHEMLVFLLRKNETVAGGLLVFLHDAKRTMYFEAASLNRKVSNRYSPMYTLFWHGIRKASEMGYTTVDLGGTPANPKDIHYRMKENFGCSFKPKYYVCFFKSRILNTAFNSLASISALFS